MMQNVCVEGVFYVHRLSVDGGSVARICGACYVVWHAGDYVCLLLLASAVSDAVIRALYFALLSILWEISDGKAETQEAWKWSLLKLETWIS